MGAKDSVENPIIGTDEEVEDHKNQLQRLSEKDPEFYQFLKDNDKELLAFNNSEVDEDESEMVDGEIEGDEDTNDSAMVDKPLAKEHKPTKSVVTSAMIDTWITSIRETKKISSVRAIIKAFRTACHCGDDVCDDSKEKYTIMSSSVFNKVMLFVLSNMDGILRELFELPPSGGKKETLIGIMSTKQWKNHSCFVKSYLSNSLHILNQMTDAEMISFTLKGLRHSSIFLAGFPCLLRKYIKVILHFWGTGEGALSVASFLFLRDICVRLGSDCIDECFKGIYKAYVMNCQFINAVKLQHIQFLGNCVIELLRVDLPTGYQHAFSFIRQLAMILRNALVIKKKEAVQKVYEWKFINCLELWTGVVCEFSLEANIRPLAYPLTQVISGVARLVPTAVYFPLRLRCFKMLNRIAASTRTFIPVCMPLLDMLEMKELNKPPSQGVGKAIDLRSTLTISKAPLKTKLVQEACVFSVIEELAEHLSQWSYSVAFFELSFIPATRLRTFCKSTKVDRFRRETREFIRQIEANCKFTNEKRMSNSILPNDQTAESFIKDEKKSGASPLSQYAATLHERSRQKIDSLTEFSVVVGAHKSVFGKKFLESDEENTKSEEGASVFSSSWLPKNNSKDKKTNAEKKSTVKNKKAKAENEVKAFDEDVVEDLVLNSDEDIENDEFVGNVLSMVNKEYSDDEEKEAPSIKQGKKKQKLIPNSKNKKSFMKIKRKRLN